MNSRSLRRLAADHAALHNSDLPPNYLFDPRADPPSDLTSLDILLAGPASTPYDLGVFKLHLAIPNTYPIDPPKAFFRTKIFHPNIEPETGAVCVETLKRDWKNTLTLRDVLVTISCLLVYPNASSALNAEAGGMLESGGGAGWEGFERRAKLMTRLQAGVPKELKDLVQEAKTRGEERESDTETKDKETRVLKKMERENSEVEKKISDAEDGGEVAPRRRRGVGRAREVKTSGISQPPQQTPREPKQQIPTPPVSTPVLARPPPPHPFVRQQSKDDVFGNIRLPHPSQTPQLQRDDDPDSSLHYTNQENSASSSILLSKPTLQPTRVLQNLHEDSDAGLESDDDVEAEFPPSPCKSPVKSRPRSSEDHYAEHPPSPRKKPTYDYPPSPRKQSAFDYPPSPRKQSPAKKASPQRRRNLFAQISDPAGIFNTSRPELFKAENSRTGGASFFTPDNPAHPALASTFEGQTPDGLTETDESEFEMSFEILRQSERKKRNLLASPPKRKVRSFLDRSVAGGGRSTPAVGRSVVGMSALRTEDIDDDDDEDEEESRSVSPERDLFAGSIASLAAPSPKVLESPKAHTKAHKTSKNEDEKNMEDLERRMWNMCGGDVERWNKGDFGGFIKVKAPRW